MRRMTYDFGNVLFDLAHYCLLLVAYFLLPIA